MKDFLKKLDKNKIDFNLNKNPIEVNTLISFLTVDVIKSKEHLGSYNGWTLFYGDDNLKLHGGLIKGVNYLNKIEYKKRLDNSYNDYVNPFYLLDILNDDGKKFFLEYYRDDIQKIKDDLKLKRIKAEEKLKETKDNESKTNEYWKSIGFD